MSRAREDDLAYGDLPQRWDRARFERFGRDGGGGGGSRFEEDIRVVERERPGRTEILISERERSRPPAARERDRFYEEDRYTSRPKRRTDRELFGDIDPRELVSGAMTTYRRPREEIDIERRSSVRPGLIRRQSSLDTFDRRSARYERDEYRVPPYVPVPLPIRRRDEGYREVEIERERSVHRRAKKEDTKSRRDSTSSSSSSSSSSSGKATSHAPTVISKISRKSKAKSTRAPSVHETIIREETRAPTVISKARSRATSVHESVHLETEIRSPSVRQDAIIEESVREERTWKKGKTRMPKRMVEIEAILDLGYPFDEEDNFFVLRVALEKEQIDEVIQASEVYRNGEKHRYHNEDKKSSAPTPAPMPPVRERSRSRTREEITRTEWINPPTIVAERLVVDDRGGRSMRGHSPGVNSSISRQISRSRSQAPIYYDERREVMIEERSPSRGRQETHRSGAILEVREPSRHHRHRSSGGGELVLAEKSNFRSDRDINLEIRELEKERRALRVERDSEDKLALAVRRRRASAGEEEIKAIEWFGRVRPVREVVPLMEVDRSPGNVIRIEKDRKERERETRRVNSKLLGAALTTLI